MDDFTTRLAKRLATLRQDKGWSLDQLAEVSGLSRATLSRLEKAEVSPTAESLGQLCSAYSLQMSRLMMQVEETHAPLVPRDQQPLWHDPATGFERRQLSPPAPTLSGEIIEGHLPANQQISYDSPSRPGLEHHLILQEGNLSLSLSEQSYDLRPGDCLRYHLKGRSQFTAGAEGARYILVLI
ncbi:helix-turn-helix domain-containing protein [Pseudophaeobacter sp.]|uniref:helix-turn-helix domain-containing protein n=1 Tax=Pseudophaeobacter sp. TaxID=1971739 RepID=UPI0032982084